MHDATLISGQGPHVLQACSVSWHAAVSMIGCPESALDRGEHLELRGAMEEGIFDGYTPPCSVKRTFCSISS